MTHEIQATMKEKITAALRTVLGQRKEAIRERLLSCLADHVEQELNDLAEPPVLDDTLFTLPSQPGETHPPEAAAPVAAAPSPPDLSGLLRTTQQLTHCEDQVSILECLIKAAAGFSGRSVVFVCRNGQAMGWEQFGFSPDLHSMAIRGASLPLAEDSILSRVVASGEGLSSDEVDLADPVWKAIGTPASTHFTAVPLTVRGRIAAILFADAGTEDNREPVQADALGILARMAEMSLETLTLRAETAQPEPAVAIQQQQATAAEPQCVEQPRASVAPVEPTVVAPPPHVFSPPTEAYEDKVSAPQPPPVLAEPVPPLVQEDLHTETLSGGNQEEPETPAEPTAEPSAESQAAEADPEEEQLHEQARRFARLLISEILLYNPDQVQEGKQHGDLADRLKEDLERSEQMYRQRVAPHVAAETNYFHEEVLRTLADGDPAVLGS